MFKKSFLKKKILITGHTGFKGTWLSIWLDLLGAELIGYSLNVPTSPSLFDSVKLDLNLLDLRGDICDLQTLTDIIQEHNPDFIFHLAAQSLVSESYNSPLETVRANTLGTATVLDALRLSNFTGVAVIVTSDKCYFNVEQAKGYVESDRLGGKDMYSASKAAAEIIFETYANSSFLDPDCRLASARAGNVIGGGDWNIDRIVPDAVTRWSEDLSLPIRMPKATRPWQHVLEPLSGYLSLASALADNDRKINRQSFNFGPPENSQKTVRDLISHLAILWGDTANWEDQSRVDFYESSLLALNCIKAKSLLNWETSLDFDAMCEFTISSYRNFYSREKPILEHSQNQILKFHEIATSKLIKWTK